MLVALIDSKLVCILEVTEKNLKKMTVNMFFVVLEYYHSMD